MYSRYQGGPADPPHPAPIKSWRWGCEGGQQRCCTMSSASGATDTRMLCSLADLRVGRRGAWLDAHRRCCCLCAGHKRLYTRAPSSVRLMKLPSDVTTACKAALNAGIGAETARLAPPSTRRCPPSADAGVAAHAAPRVQAPRLQAARHAVQGTTTQQRTMTRGRGMEVVHVHRCAACIPRGSAHVVVLLTRPWHARKCKPSCSSTTQLTILA